MLRKLSVGLRKESGAETETLLRVVYTVETYKQKKKTPQVQHTVDIAAWVYKRSVSSECCRKSAFCTASAQWVDYCPLQKGHAGMVFVVVVVVVVVVAVVVFFLCVCVLLALQVLP